MKAGLTVVLWEYTGVQSAQILLACTVIISLEIDLQFVEPHFQSFHCFVVKLFQEMEKLRYFQLPKTTIANKFRNP